MIIYLSKKRLGPLDTALLRGYGVYEYLRTYGELPFKLEEHLDRLERSCAMMHLEIPCSRAVIRETILSHCLKGVESSIKIFAGGGEASDDLVPDGETLMFVAITPLVPFDRAYYEQGIKLLSYVHERPFPLCKSSNYVAAILASRLAKQEGALEPLFISQQGKVLETARSNVFFVKGDEVFTPKEGVLKGITRQVILDIYPVVEREVDFHETWDEAFITSSNKEVMPVVQIDHRVIGKGNVGKISKKISTFFSEVTNEKKSPQALATADF